MIAGIVVLTHPAYFYSSISTLKTVFEIQKWDGPVHLIVDDHRADTHYVDDLKTALDQNFNGRAIQIKTTSSITWLDNIQEGWFRQQLIKLNLDSILTKGRWFVIDGDVRLGTEISESRFYAELNQHKGKLDQGFVGYVEHMLAISTGSVIYQNRPIRFSSIPLRFLDSDVLWSLRHHVEQVHQVDFISLHRHMIESGLIVRAPRPGKLIMSEWELIETYRCNVLGDFENLSQIGVFGWNDDPGRWFDQWIRSFWGKDTDVGQRRFQDIGILVDDAIWQKYHQKNKISVDIAK